MATVVAPSAVAQLKCLPDPLFEGVVAVMTTEDERILS
jgi:hypothetical protein